MNDTNQMDGKKKEKSLARMSEEIQKQIIEEEKIIYSNKIIELYNSPINFGRIEDADVYAMIHGWCGDTMEMFLKVEGGIIKDISFMTDGCGATLAAGSMLTIMVKGQSIEEARKINEEDLLDALGGLPDENLHCAALSVNTLREAIGELLKKRGRQAERKERLKSKQGR